MCAMCIGSAASLSSNLKQSPDSPRGAGSSQQFTEAISPLRKQAELPQTKLNHLRRPRTRTFHHSEHQLKVNKEVTTFFAMSLMMIICCGAFAALSPMLNQKKLQGWTGTGWPEALKTFKATWQRYNEEPNSVEDSRQTSSVPVPEDQEIWKEDTQQSSQNQETGPPKNKPQTELLKLVAIPVENKISRGYKRLMKKDRKFMVWLPPEIPGSPWVWSGSALPPAMVV